MRWATSRCSSWRPSLLSGAIHVPAPSDCCWRAPHRYAWYFSEEFHPHGGTPAELASTDRLDVAMLWGFSWYGSYSVLLSDVDVVWMRDPSHFLAAPGLSTADIAVTSDCIFDFMRPDQQLDDAYGIHAASRDAGAKRLQLLAAQLRVNGRARLDCEVRTGGGCGVSRTGQRRSVLNAEFNTGVLLVRATDAGRDFATRCVAHCLLRRWRNSSSRRFSTALSNRRAVTGPTGAPVH
jgi:hypothetical protein